MNTQAGKSIGIALLLAAGLLAALFAMGVFAPTGVGAAVKTGGEAPEVTLSSNAPGRADVTLTAEFTVNAEVDSAPNNVWILVPDALGTNLDATDYPPDTDKITVKQNGNSVGNVSPTIAGGLLIQIDVHDTDTTKNLKPQVRTTLEITGVTNAEAGSVDVTFLQARTNSTDSDVIDASQSVSIYPSVLPSPRPELEFGNVAMAGDMAGTANLKITFTVDAPATANDHVMITLDGVTISTTTTPIAEDDTVTSIIQAGNIIDVSLSPGFEDDQTRDEIEITVTTVEVPTGTTRVLATFRHDGQSEEDAAIAALYFTESEDLAFSVSEVDPPDAGAEDSEITFEFPPVVNTEEQDIRITLHSGFKGLPDASDPDIVVPPTLEALQEQSGINEIVGNISFDAETNIFTITAQTDEDENDIIRSDGPVTVTVSGLTNPDTVGLVVDAVTIKQGGHPASSANIRLTGTQISTTTAGAAVRVKVSTVADSVIPPGEDIRVDLEGFVLPESMEEDQVILDGGDRPLDTPTEERGRYYGPPSSISIASGRYVTLSIPTTYGNGNPVDAGVPAGNVYTITFKIGAGIKNPNVVRGARPVEASDQAFDNPDTDVTSKVSAKNAEMPKRGANASRGDEVTFSVVGLKAGSATLYLMKGMCVDAVSDLEECRNETGALVTDEDGNSPVVDEDGDPYEEDDDFRIGNGPQVDGKVSVVRRVTSTLFEANEDLLDAAGDNTFNTLGNYYGQGPREFAGVNLVGTNIIYSVDGTGLLSDTPGRLAIEPTVELGTDSIKQGGLLELDISDWYYGTISDIEVGGVPVELEWSGGQAIEFDPQPVGGDGELDGLIVVMPPGVRLGDQQLKLTGSTTDEQSPTGAGNFDSFATTITVDPLDLQITPVNAEGIPEVVINQEFTVEGRGFNTETNACILSVKFGDVIIDETTAGVDVECENSDGLRPDTAGNFSATFRLDPGVGGVSSLKVGEYRVEVKDNEERVGIVDVLIPEPIVEVTPASSRRGSTVTVVGSKFPASSELAVEIKYGLAGNEKTITAATPDSVGSWRETFVIPTNAIIGEDHVVKAAPINTSYDHFEGKGTHRLPEQEVIVTPSRVAAGGRIRVEGHNMPLFTGVALKISNITVSGQGFETDGVGSFVKTAVLVPQLQPGIHTVEALVQTQGQVQPVSVRTSVEVADIVTRPSTEAFEDLISAGTLTRVWHLDRATQAWSFFDPSPDFSDFNTLAEVSSGQIVTIIMNASDTFQGTTLFVGSNPIAIE